MRAIFTLVRRELASYLVTWTGYILIAAAAFLMGWSFVVMLVQLRLQSSPMPVTELFFGTQYFWFILLLTAPLITMRLFAAEKLSGTFETLMTTPVRDGQVVAAKFIAALIFFLLLWTPLVACLLVAARFTGGGVALDAGTLGGALFGLVLLGALFLAIGCFASALTRSQIVAAMTSLVICLGLFLLSFLSESLATATGWVGRLLACAALANYMDDFSRGIVDTRPVVFCLSLTAFFLFLTLRVVESRRWS